MGWEGNSVSALSSGTRVAEYTVYLTISYTTMGQHSEMIHEKMKKKLVVAGDGACGKTAILMVQSGLPFPDDYHPTIFENFISRIQLTRDKIVELSLWDTAGQEEYDRLRPLSYPDTDVILLVFSTVDRISFEAISEKVRIANIVGA